MYRKREIVSVMPYINRLRAHLAVPIESLVTKFLQEDEQAENDLVTRFASKNWKSDTNTLQWGNKHTFGSLKSPREWTLMGLIFEFGINKPVDLLTAKMCYEKAADDGVAQCRLGYMYCYTKKFLNHEKAKACLEIAKTKNISSAFTFLGVIAHREQDTQNALNLLCEGYTRGCPLAPRCLAEIQRDSKGQLIKKFNEIQDVYLESVGRGVATLLTGIAEHFLTQSGRPVGQNDAVFIARFAAELGGPHEHTKLAEYAKQLRAQNYSFSCFDAAIGLRESKEHKELATAYHNSVKEFYEWKPESIEMLALETCVSEETFSFLTGFDKRENYTEHEKEGIILISLVLISNPFDRDTLSLILGFLYPPLVMKKKPSMLEDEEKAKSKLQRLIDADLFNMFPTLQDSTQKEDIVKKQKIIELAQQGIVPYSTALRNLFFTTDTTLLAPQEVDSKGQERVYPHL